MLEDYLVLFSPHHTESMSFGKKLVLCKDTENLNKSTVFLFRGSYFTLRCFVFEDFSFLFMYLLLFY